MLERIAKASILNKIFNVYGKEWPKVALAWSMRFLYRVGFVLGWTIIVAMFVSRYGILSLPYLLAVNALFTILGSIVFSTFIEKISRQQAMLMTLLISVVLLFAAIKLAPFSDAYFFLLIVIAESIFLVQFRLLLDAFKEDLFTPLSSERTFPIIEASETLAGIVAGLLVFSLASTIATFNFVYIWIILLLAIIPLLLVFTNIDKSVMLLKRRSAKNIRRQCSVLAEIKREIKCSKHFSYIKNLTLIVLFQWLLFNLIEFQYTRAVYQNASNLILESGSGFEHALVHDLGALFALFNFSALIIQLFFAGRLIRSLGIVGGMMLHPIVTLLGLFGLVFNLGFPAAVLAKNNFVVTSAVHMNAYHSAYYAIKDRFREYVREFLEGIIRPLGAFAGTLLLILLQVFFTDMRLVVYVNVLMIAVVLFLLYIEHRQQSVYTAVAADDLTDSSSRNERMNAIEILSQNGHEASWIFLKKFLMDDNAEMSLRMKILRGLQESQDLDALESVTNLLDSPDSNIREAALETLGFYEVMGKSDSRYLFFKYQVFERAKKLYRRERNEDVRTKIITLMSKLGTISVLDFLLQILQKANPNLRAEAISALGKYDNESVIEYIRPFLSSKNLHLKTNAAIALGRFKHLENEALHTILSLLYSKQNRKISYAIYAIGELKLRSNKKICLQYLESRNKDLRMCSALALGKMGYAEAIPVIVDLIFDKDYKLATRVRKALSNLDVRIYKKVDKIVRKIVEEKLEQLTVKRAVNSLDDLNKKNLKALRWLYSLVDQYEEVTLINNMLNS